MTVLVIFGGIALKLEKISIIFFKFLSMSILAMPQPMTGNNFDA